MDEMMTILMSIQTVWMRDVLLTVIKGKILGLI